MSALSRRRFVQGAGVAGLGLLVGCGRLPGQAQPPGSRPRLGYVGSEKTLPMLRLALTELGYAEGTNLFIDVRQPGGLRPVRVTALEELVPTRPDIIVTTGIGTTRSARDLTDTIPIVQAAGGGDLVAAGIVDTLARPGGNVTGVTELMPLLAGKRLELLRSTIPGLLAVGAIWNAANPDARLEVDELSGATRALSVTLHEFPVQDFDALERAIHTAARDRVGPLVIVQDGLTIDRESRIAALVLENELPSISSQQIYAEAGGLMSYGGSFAYLTRRAAYYVDRILKGAKPADLPVEQPREFDFVLNLKTAHALGLTISPHVLGQATEVIQ